MATTSRAAYYKHNLAWPVAWAGAGLVQVSLAERYESAIRHLLSTPRGSLYSDPNYGTTVHQLRAQPMNTTMVATVLAHLRQSTAQYIPDIMIVDLQAEVDQNEEKLKVSCLWLIRNATAQMHGVLANRKTTTVLI